MVRRSRHPFAAPVVAVFVVATAFTGCTPVLKAGLGLLGIRTAETHGIDGAGRGGSITPPAYAEHPPTIVGGYESAPTYTWDRYATASPVSFARFMSQGIDGATCSPTSPGLARVLPVGEGSPAVGVQHFGPITVGLAGPGTRGLRELWLGNPVGFAQAAMQETARMGTYNECERGIFAFVTLGTGSYDPVVVR